MHPASVVLTGFPLSPHGRSSHDQKGTGDSVISRYANLSFPSRSPFTLWNHTTHPLPRSPNPLSLPHKTVQGADSTLMDVISQNVRNADLNRCLALSGFALLLYDYILTFPTEVDRFWSPLKIRQWGTFIFIANRYIGLLGHIPVIYSYFLAPSPDLVFLAVVVQTCAGAIMLTRVYALWDRNRIILWSLLVYYFGFAGFAAWAITQGEPPPLPLVPPSSLGCVTALSKDEGYYFALVWGGIVIFDSIVFTLTVYKSVVLWRHGSRGLVHVVMRDGVVYYAVLGFSTLSNALTFVLGSALTRGVNTLMTNMLACALCSRLMLNLRDPRVVRYPTESGNAYGSPSSTEPFALTTVVMSDMGTFQTGAEQHSTGLLGIGDMPRT